MSQEVMRVAKDKELLERIESKTKINSIDLSIEGLQVARVEMVCKIKNKKMKETKDKKT